MFGKSGQVLSRGLQKKVPSESRNTFGDITFVIFYKRKGGRIGSLNKGKDLLQVGVSFKDSSLI